MVYAGWLVSCRITINAQGLLLKRIQSPLPGREPKMQSPTLEENFAAVHKLQRAPARILLGVCMHVCVALLIYNVARAAAYSVYSL